MMPLLQTVPHLHSLKARVILETASRQRSSSTSLPTTPPVLKLAICQRGSNWDKGQSPLMSEVLVLN